MSKTHVKIIESCTQCDNCELWAKESYYRNHLYICIETGRVIGILGVTDSISKMTIPEWCPLEDRL